MKLRVWDKKEKRWASVRNLLLNRIGPSKIYSINHPEDLDRFVFQSFSGQQDSLGNDVYEGDIMDNEYCGYYGRVIFERAAFMIRYPSGYTTSLFPIGSYKIRGNIFDNPELCETY